MSAEILREAASLMRERADGARAGKWRIEPSALAPDTTLIVAEWQNDLRRVATASGSLPEGNFSNANHIASWHPAVALAVADSLEQAAATLAEAESGPLYMAMRAIAEPLVDVARAYMGGDA